jgi:two-component system phosphate regulon sensor histidine kinase PhoR
VTTRAFEQAKAQTSAANHAGARVAVVPAWAALAGLAPTAAVIATLLLTDLIAPGPAAALAVAAIIPAAWFASKLRHAAAAVAEASPPSLPVVRQDILESLPDPVIVLNKAREIITVNRAARDVLGVGLLGRDLALSIRHPGVLAAVETVAASRSTLSEEITLPVPVPRTFTLHAAATVPVPEQHQSTPLAREDGADAPHVVLVFRDETRAKKAEQSQADFVANASHELRSPLSSLIGFIETLRGHASNDAEARERFLQVMHGEALRMARLVDELMSLTRVEINEHVPPRDTVDLGETLAAVAATLATRAEAKQMTVTVDCPDSLPCVVGDHDELTQVFHNLVDNAIKYARPGTPIRLSARCVNRLPWTGTEGVAIAVADQSDGIPAIHIPRLTERFYRVDEGRSRRLGGTGLGLAIVKHIVNRHRGRLVIESTEGVGSVFTVLLPASPQGGAVRP